jgi:putative transposase
MMKLIDDGRETASVKDLCKAYGVSEASYYRWKTPESEEAPDGPKKRHWRSLNEDEEKCVLETLTSDRFVDVAPEAIVATLLDEGKYLCSARTMYRILKKNASTKERRDQRRHPEYVKPELLATGPNQVWSWDITKLKTGRKWE